jgi:hypothetical protein
MKKDLKELWDSLNTAGRIVLVLGGIFAVWLLIVTLHTALTTKERQQKAQEDAIWKHGK